MHTIFENLTKKIEFTSDLKRNIHLFLTINKCPQTADHCIDVGTEARRLAFMFEANHEAAEIAGWLHDISAVFPNSERIDISRQLQIDILPEEELFPMIIHQKISKVMARDIFGITDQEILDAVGCHTTLRANATLLDQVLFVADKIAWDQSGAPPYIEELNRNLKNSLTHGAFAYINYLWERQETLKVVHPWLKEAYEELKNKVSIF
ncbi:bis(5'-nucleosyl)-tetraphosphatase (symmetrical) YqeK [Paenibacillus antarcticus]|uniref:bis(5'-nucleosyl)-tetraphosphatase (symmetrical) n=1 Tax=Paenibacillus antarcticus TaxID=253703 RepID=A0A168PXK4_9BACL|nr:bis(5'-nucleosyl)-tetraphosphatase (symmetrical) YqeK [Paenibacillus antarcticus]OAB47168.1 HAD family hydrolase [Paenibacillus antarcticus]